MNSTIQALLKLYENQLNHLEKEINAFTAEDNYWLTPGDVNNSAGNLCLHLCGNLQFFIGSILGDTGYVRKRDEEFSKTGLSKTELIQEINVTREAVLKTLPKILESTLQNTYPIEVFGNAMTTEFFLIHLHGHLNYHLGQISYHRRILDKG